MKVFGHRGYSGMYPENTMLSFQKAADTGCYGIELDVQLTKDGQLVVIHDETIDRTTDGTGAVVDYTFEELRRFDASAIKGGTHGFQPIPSFEEYCEWVKERDLVTNIEIKSGVYYYEDIEEKTVEMVRRFGLTDRVLFSSFNHASLFRLQQLDPEIPRGALVEYVDLGNAGYYCERYGFQNYHPGVEWLTEENVKNCKAHGVGVNVWTVNDMGVLEKLYEWGCDGVFTNYPGVCKAWLDTREA